MAARSFHQVAVGCAELLAGTAPEVAREGMTGDAETRPVSAYVHWIIRFK
jgi:hypothetical protein